MPSVAYMNQYGPFWDFVANLEQQGVQHPFFSQNRGDNNESGEEGHQGHQGHHHHHLPPPPFGGWGWGFPFGRGRGFPHRGPPPPPGPPPPAGAPEENGQEYDQEKEKGKERDPEKHLEDNGEGPAENSGSDNEGRWGRRGRCGARRGRHGPCGGGRGAFAHGRHHPHHHGRRGGPWRGPWASYGNDNNNNSNNGFDPLAFAASFFEPANNDTTGNKDANEDFTPEADIFDTDSAFVIHVSLPGAKKEDVGVNWDAEKSELSIAGVVYRPGDEDFLKTLAMDERKVGPFERKIRLGTRANPATIDVEGIVARLEDGVLRVEVPKLEGGFVEVRKVDVM